MRKITLRIAGMWLVASVCLSALPSMAFADSQSGSPPPDNKKLHVVVGKVTKKADGPSSGGKEAPKDPHTDKGAQGQSH